MSTESPSAEIEQYEKGMESGGLLKCDRCEAVVVAATLDNGSEALVCQCDGNWAVYVDPAVDQDRVFPMKWRQD